MMTIFIYPQILQVSMERIIKAKEIKLIPLNQNINTQSIKLEN